MKTTRAAVAAFIALTAIAACSTAGNETADTTTIPGVDTMSGTAIPTTDTVVKTTTTDTLQGQADTTKAGTKRP